MGPDIILIASRTSRRHPGHCRRSKCRQHDRGRRVRLSFAAVAHHEFDPQQGIDMPLLPAARLPNQGLEDRARRSSLHARSGRLDLLLHDISAMSTAGKVVECFRGWRVLGYGSPARDRIFPRGL